VQAEMSVLAHPDVPTHPPGRSIRSAPGHVAQATGRSSSTDSPSMPIGNRGVVPARGTLAADTSPPRQLAARPNP
jgi:hypothetical protein